MSRAYMVPIGTDTYTYGDAPRVFTIHEFVHADSVEQAESMVPNRTGPAKLAVPWDELPGEQLPEVRLTDGQSREPDGTPGLKHSRTREVIEWLLTYTGRNTFVQDVAFKVKNGRRATGQNVGQRKAYRLSYKQVDALAKVKDREAEWAKQREANKTGLNLWAALPYGTTRAAAENDRGSLSFVRIDKVERGKWADWVFVKAILGDSEDMRLGSQRPDSDEYIGQWASVLARVAADPVAAVARYGLELGVCGVCGRQLTNEESRAGGIGPVCRGRLNRAA